MGSKSMEEMFANMPNPDAMFQSWWPFIIAGVSGTLYGVRQWLRGPKCIGGSKLRDKTAIITGANTGIGKEIALDFANRGAKVILACRDEAAGKKAAEDIRKESENMDVYCLKLDLNSFSSIRNFVEKFKKKEKKLQILINNAGVMMCPQEKTEDGFDVQFQSNYLGHFLLTELLLDLLKESAPSRIVNVTAAAQNLGEINFDDINHERKEYNAGDAYAQSKLAVTLHAFQLAQRLQDTKVVCNVVNPGICNTDVYRHLPLKSKKFIRVSFSPFMWYLMKTAEDGAQMSIYCATTEEAAEITGKYFKGSKAEELTGNAVDKMLQEQLYRASLKWTKQGSTGAVTGGEDGDGEEKEDDSEGTEKGEKKAATTASKMERVDL